MRAALYIRVSSDEQAREGYSIIAQKDLLERKAAENNLTVEEVYIDDGYSGKNTKRPALQRMLKDAEQKRFDLVFFWRLDRLTRRSRDFHLLTDQLLHSRVGLMSATEKIDTTSAFGQFQVELSVSLAQLERETISERVTFVAEERARKGIRNGGPAPLGYDLIDKTKLIVNEKQAMVVRWIFDTYLQGVGYKSIAHQLIRDPDTAPLAAWSGPAVKYILENPVYAGKVRWNHVSKRHKNTPKLIEDGSHVPIIDELLFQRVQNEIKRRTLGGKRFTTDYLFSGVLRCARCGSTMHGGCKVYKGKQYRWYRCGGKIDRGICTMQAIRENGVIDAFLDALNMEEAELEKYMPDAEARVNLDRERIDSIQRELDAIARRKKNWQLAFANDLMTLDELRAHTEEDRSREELLRKQLEQIQPQAHSFWTKEELLQQLKQLRIAWPHIDNDRAKKQFINEAFDYIVIDLDPNSEHGQGRRTKVVITDFKFRA